MFARQTFLLASVCLAWSFTLSVQAAPNAKEVEFFETKIRPVLVNQCYECHSAQSAKVKGGLLLDTRDGLLKGGDNGPGLVPGKPEQSLLIKSLQHEGKLKMPPKTKLSDNVIRDFVEWVRLGAPDPRDAKSASNYKRMTLDEAKSFWSFKPVTKVALPKVKDASWAKDDADRFVLAKLEAQGIKPVASADKQTLLRRVYFDLVGLPPSPAEVDAFLNDTSSEALAKVVDKLLASPHFGERWGRHWLDIARYAETNGNADNAAFPQAYHYRDYVIRSVNADKPYDQFIREQIAGDLLPAKSPAEKDEQLIATGLLALTSKPRAQNNPDYRMDLIADQIDVTSRAVLGMSVLCARCHDHKFDPISTKEYYALAGFFDSTVMLFGTSAGKAANANKGVTLAGYHKLSTGTEVMGIRDGKPTDTAICVRGDSTKKGDTVPRNVLTVATLGELPKVNTATSGRVELATWLTAKENPLPARVAVNRIWLHLFGQGIVKSADNFGSLGEKPSHPELLDHLAYRFMENGWSTKKMIRSLVLSRAYQLSSLHDAKNYEKDPDNTLVWRMNRRRLEAEPIRDAMLAVAGNLDTKPPQGSLSGVAANGNKRAAVNLQDKNVRSVYLGVVRGAPMPEILTMFDVASPNLVVAQRDVTTVPAQSLFLMNSPFVLNQAKVFAQRVQDNKLMDIERVDLAYRLAYSRPASETEKSTAIAYLQKAGGDKGWAHFCQALLASAEFRYLQ